jgi:ferredoxin
MILTTSKGWSEIQAAIKDWKLQKVVVVGCGSCSAQCGTGGTEGVKKLVEQLQKEGLQILASIVIEEPCDARAIKHDFYEIKTEVDQADGFIVAACGSGAQTIFENTKKPVIITTNTLMMGQTERIGVYHEKCRACGRCLLNETGGICPITACAKSLLNGPCGGMIDGKCEVGNYTHPCGWIEIFDRLKTMNRLDLFKKVRLPLDWSLESQRFTVDVQNEMKEYYVCKEN